MRGGKDIMKITINIMEERRCASCDVTLRGKSKPYHLEQEIVFLCKECEEALGRREKKREVGA